MATEKLIVQLEAQTQKLDAGLDRSKKKLDDITESSMGADDSLKKMSLSSGGLATAISGIATAAGVAAGAVGALTANTIAYAKEVRLAAQLSGLQAEKLQLMAFATSTVGVSMEQLGDISKDTKEKVGDFLNTGGGGFMDFVDAMKMTKSEAASLATEFLELSGPEVLQRMVDMMEAAKVPTAQMSHALEGMASETTRLIPLLRDGGREMSILGNEAAKLTVPLSGDDLEKLKRLDVALSAASETMSNLSNRILVDLSDWFVRAAETASHFYASLNQGTVSQKTERLVAIKDEIDTIKEGLENAESAAGRFWNVITFNTQQEGFAQERINALLEERKVLQQEIAESGGLSTPELGSMKRTEKGDSSDSVGLWKEQEEEKSNAALEAIENRFKSEEILLAEKLERELELAKNNEELKIQLFMEYDEKIAELRAVDQELLQEQYDNELFGFMEMLDNKLISVEEYNQKVSKLNQKYGKDDAKANKKFNKDKETSEQAYADAAIGIADQLFQEDKAVQAGIVVAKTGAAVMHQLGSGDPYTAFPRAAAAAALGALQLTQTLGASKGGGSISGGSGSSGAQQSAPTQVTGGIEINESLSTGGSTSNNLTITAENGDIMAEALGKVLESMIRDGKADFLRG